MAIELPATGMGSEKSSSYHMTGTGGVGGTGSVSGMGSRVGRVDGGLHRSVSTTAVPTTLGNTGRGIGGVRVCESEGLTQSNHGHTFGTSTSPPAITTRIITHP